MERKIETRNNRGIDYRCSNRDCFKSHCWRHWKNHDGAGASNLNPYGETMCPYYLSKFEVDRVERTKRIRQTHTHKEGERKERRKPWGSR